MIDMTGSGHGCAPMHRSHFHGNGTCDAVREANKREDRAGAADAAYTGMESELAPYGDAAAAGYDDPEYGPGHEFTEAQEEGMNSLPQDDFDAPMSADEAARNSWRALLARNVGRSVLVRFLMGTQNLITVEGELYEVGTDYIVIYQPLWDSHITADLYSVKFVEFREPPGVMTLA